MRIDELDNIVEKIVEKNRGNREEVKKDLVKKILKGMNANPYGKVYNKNDLPDIFSNKKMLLSLEKILSNRHHGGRRLDGGFHPDQFLPMVAGIIIGLVYLFSITPERAGQGIGDAVDIAILTSNGGKRKKRTRRRKRKKGKKTKKRRIRGIVRR